MNLSYDLSCVILALLSSPTSVEYLLYALFWPMLSLSNRHQESSESSLEHLYLLFNLCFIHFDLKRNRSQALFFLGPRDMVNSYFFNPINRISFNLHSLKRWAFGRLWFFNIRHHSLEMNPPTTYNMGSYPLLRVRDQCGILGYIVCEIEYQLKRSYSFCRGDPILMSIVVVLFTFFQCLVVLTLKYSL